MGRIDFSKELEAFLAPVEHVWRGTGRRGKDTVRSGHLYAQALCAPGSRKSMEPLSAIVDVGRDQFYQFITRSPWDWEEMQDQLIPLGTARSVFRDTGGLYVDSTENSKKGEMSIGVKRQYSGHAGKVDNCQAFVTLVYGEMARANRDSLLWPLRMRVYLPEEWANDAERREAAGVPREIEFKTKNEMALAMIGEVRDRVPHRFIGADSAFGKDGALRRQLREWEEPYVLAVPSGEIRCAPDLPLKPKPYAGVGARPKPRLPDNAVSRSPEEWARSARWRTMTWTQGTKGPIKVNVARKRVRVTVKGGVETDETGWLLLEKTPEGEIKSWICWGVDDATLPELVRMAHHRWVIEDAFSLMKGELGLDHFEGRTWQGTHHHATMAMLALAFLETLRFSGEKKTAPPSDPSKTSPRSEPFYGPSA